MRVLCARLAAPLVLAGLAGLTACNEQAPTAPRAHPIAGPPASASIIPRSYLASPRYTWSHFHCPAVPS